MNLGNSVSISKLENLIESIFQGSPKVYEAYSIPDKNLRIFKNKTEVMDYIDEVSKGKDKNKLVYLSIHYPQTKGYIKKKKINLVPEKCNGAKIRYSVEGWGIIQFQLWLKETGLFCEIGSNSEKRATAWEATSPELKSPNLWEWKEVQRQCLRLKRVIKQSA